MRFVDAVGAVVGGTTVVGEIVVVGATVVVDTTVVVVVGAIAVVDVGAIVIVVGVGGVAAGVDAAGSLPPLDAGAVVVGAIVVVVVVVGATVVVVDVVEVVDVVVVVGGTVVVVVVVVVVVGAVGVITSLDVDGTPSPIALRAVTRNWYDVAFVSPDTVADVALDTPSATVTQLVPSDEYSTR